MFKADIQSQLTCLINTKKKIIIIGDFNVDGTADKSCMLQFIIKKFKCHQYVKKKKKKKKKKTDFVSILDMVFSNTEVASDVIESYWSDHKIIYCALDTPCYSIHLVCTGYTLLLLKHMPERKSYFAVCFEMHLSLFQSVQP